jgi:glucan phosphoethanolaminetransferase (alkaline phosphatase superfamily)
MWQRIQTVFLVIAVVSLIASIFLPIWGYQGNDGVTHELYPLHYSTIQNGARTTNYFPYCITAVLAIASATLATVSIRRYDNRLLQLKIGALNSLLIAGTIASGIILSNVLMKATGGGQYGYGLFIPGIAVVCNLVANQFIRRDEKLVRDSNRLR